MVSVTGDTITIIRQGEFVPPLLVEPLMPWTAVFRSTPVSSRRKSRPMRNMPNSVRWSGSFREGDYGFIEDQEGAEIYFHANALKNGKFEKLEPGTEVKFSAEKGEKGLQAVWVRPLG